jgi:hypothetical protein
MSKEDTETTLEFTKKISRQEKMIRAMRYELSAAKQTIGEQVSTILQMKANTQYLTDEVNALKTNLQQSEKKMEDMKLEQRNKDKAEKVA